MTTHSRFLKFAVPLFALGLLGTTYAGDAQAQAADHGSVTIAMPSPSSFFILPVVAKEQGFFDNHGVDATVQYVQPGVSSPALAGGQIQFGMIAGHVAHTLSLQGANVIDVATLVETPMASVVVSADIDSLEDLRGKAVAFSVPTSITTLLFRDMLRENGVDPDSELQVRVIAATPDQVSALNSGAVSAIMATKPLDLIAEAQGARILEDLALSDMRWPFASLLANGAYAAENPDAVVAVVRALLDARTWWVENPEEAKALIGRELNLDNQEIIDVTYQQAAEAFRAEPLPTLELSQLVLDSLHDVDGFANAADADPARFIDASFVERALQ